MDCPKCGSDVRKIKKTFDFPHRKRRRVECVQCGYRYTTEEKIMKQKGYYEHQHVSRASARNNQA